MAEYIRVDDVAFRLFGRVTGVDDSIDKTVRVLLRYGTKNCALTSSVNATSIAVRTWLH